MHKNLRDLKITPDTCTEKCTKIAQGMKLYVISSSEKKWFWLNLGIFV